jgi:hypothetical protein
VIAWTASPVRAQDLSAAKPSLWAHLWAPPINRGEIAQGQIDLEANLDDIKIFNDLQVKTGTFRRTAVICYADPPDLAKRRQ